MVVVVVALMMLIVCLRLLLLMVVMLVVLFPSLRLFMMLAVMVVLFVSLRLLLLGSSAGRRWTSVVDDFSGSGSDTRSFFISFSFVEYFRSRSISNT